MVVPAAQAESNDVGASGAPMEWASRLLRSGRGGVGHSPRGGGKALPTFLLVSWCLLVCWLQCGSCAVRSDASENLQRSTKTGVQRQPAVSRRPALAHAKALEPADWMRARARARDEICIPCRARFSIYTDFSSTFLFVNFVPVKYQQYNQLRIDAEGQSEVISNQRVLYA